MRVGSSIGWGSLLAVALAITIYGIALASTGDISDQCQGVVYDFNACTADRLRQSILGGILAGAGIVAAAILTGAAALASRLTPRR